jgi:hypothetical protein
MDGIGQGIGQAFFAVGIFCAVLAAIIMGAIWFFVSSDEIKSEKRIEPKIELIIKDNKVDTLFIYKEPK